jgi:nitrate reductase NapD|tara:strand:- start:404 stop:673 length:270 start_codon:yes stop_codon:yes gene_type:complete
VNEEVHISSIVVQGNPVQVDTIAAMIGELPRAEISLSTGQGKLIVLLEANNESEIAERVALINAIEGVLSVALIYHHCEPSDSLEEEIV